jgi:hypothetical protein
LREARVPRHQIGQRYAPPEQAEHLADRDILGRKAQAQPAVPSTHNGYEAEPRDALRLARRQPQSLPVCPSSIDGLNEVRGWFRIQD